MRLKIDDHGLGYFVIVGSNQVAAFAVRSDAEAFVKLKEQEQPLPEPVKHRCRCKTSGTVHAFVVMERPDGGNASIFVPWNSWYSEPSFRARFDILPECE